MHLLLTDRLICPRCGPPHGLILLADEVADRRVYEGTLGCSNCREEYEVQSGFADLRRPPREPFPDPVASSSTNEEEALQLAALFGVERGPGFLLLLGETAVHAPSIAAAIEDIEVIAADPMMRALPEAPGVSRIAVHDELPFFQGGIRGVAMIGDEAERKMNEGVRVLAAGSHLVVLHPSAATSNLLSGWELKVVVEDPRAVVGVRI